MKFKQGNEWVTLRGDPTLVRSSISVRSLQKLCDVDFYALLYSAEFFLLASKTGLDLNIPQQKELVSLFQHYNSTRTCHAMNVQLGSTQIQVDCFVFPLGTVDLILGISWLATLGEVRSNWAEPSMKFKQGNEWVTPHGDPTLVRSAILVRSL